MIVSVCPTSIVTAVGAIDTVGATSTTIVEGVPAETVRGVGCSGGSVNGSVPVSVIVTVITQLPDAVSGVKVSVIASELAKLGQVPDTIDQE